MPVGRCLLGGSKGFPRSLLSERGWQTAVALARGSVWPGWLAIAGERTNIYRKVYARFFFVVVVVVVVVAFLTEIRKWRETET